MRLEGKHFKRDTDGSQSAQAAQGTHSDLVTCGMQGSELQSAQLQAAQLREARVLTMLKWVAMIFLIVDHVSLALLDNLIWGRILGRIAFPIFAYLIALGVQYSSHPQNYLKRLFLFALISEVPFDMLFSGVPLDFRQANVLFTFVIAVSALLLIKRWGSQPYIWLLVAGPSLVLAELFQVDYGAFGVASVLLYSLGCFGFDGTRRRPLLGQVLGLSAVSVIYVAVEGIQHGFSQVYLQIFAVMSLGFMLWSTAQKASFTPGSKRRAKLWYLVYPGHMIIALILALALHIYTFPTTFISW